MTVLQRTCLVALGLLAAGCGGGGGDATPPASTARVASHTAQLPDTVAAASATAAATARPADPMPLATWLARLAAARAVAVTADPAIAAIPVAAPLPAANADDDIKAALADFDLLLGYSRRGGQRAELASVQVLPRGGLASRPAPMRAATAAAPSPAAEADPEEAIRVIEQELGSTDAAVRSAALARSFQLEAPLPAPTLVAAMQGDAWAEVRLYALMALARHPAVEPAQRRALAEMASQDADPAVRAQAAEVVARIDADTATP